VDRVHLERLGADDRRQQAAGDDLDAVRERRTALAPVRRWRTMVGQAFGFVHRLVQRAAERNVRSCVPRQIANSGIPRASTLRISGSVQASRSGSSGSAGSCTVSPKCDGARSTPSR